MIPITAIISKNERSYVTKVVEGEQQQVPVETGMSDGYNIAVESGLQPGDKIILNTYKQAADKTEENQKDIVKKENNGKMGYDGK